VKLCLQGDETLDERLTIINQQEKILIDTITQLNEQLALLKFKKQYYKTAHQAINN
ncbi:MerR family transcriptional regulator, partial [Gilliamella apicola]